MAMRTGGCILLLALHAGAFIGDPPEGDAWVAAVTSTTVTVGWRPIAGATRQRVYLMADPEGSKLQVESLAATARSYKLTALAPASPVFIRIEANTARGIVERSLAAHTKGGPRAALDTPVPEVHGYAPDVLMIVLAGGDGAAWQAPGWKVSRAGGAPIAIRAVNRESLPVGAPDYQVGYGKPYRDDVLDVDHRLYLSLAESIGSAEILHVEGPQGIRFLLTFNDRYLETPVIHLNQAGYYARATARFAYISGWMGDGGALRLEKFPSEAQILDCSHRDGVPPAVRYTLPVTVRSASDEEAGGEVRQIDLSGVAPAEGVTLRVRLPGVGVSWPTSVSQASAHTSFYILSRGLFLNRWGGDLGRQYTEWTRLPDRHRVYSGEQSDFSRLYPESTPRIGEKRITAGYHDAGDFEQRPMSIAVPELLMRAFELHPNSFRDGELNIPESGNGIPDLLDEALWGVTLWEQLQEPDGGVREGIQSHRHPWGFYLASEDPLPYWTFARDPNITARAVGVFAQAARLVRPYDARRAPDLEKRAALAWHYLDAHPASNASRLYAAGELYRLTHDRIYRDAFEQAWREMGPAGAFSNFSPNQLSQADYAKGQRTVADFLLGYLLDPSADPEIRSLADKRLTAYANDAVKRTETEHAYRNPRPARYAMDWGQGATMVRFLDTVIARLQMGGLDPSVHQQYLNALSLAADYVFGGNPNGLVYITGLGSVSVQEPLHLDSLVFLKRGKGPMPGIPVFGPTSSAPKAPYTLPAIAAFYPAFAQRPLGLRYADVRTVPNFNEFSVWETQAPEAELFAILLGEDRP
jgi:endoglucanase